MVGLPEGNKNSEDMCNRLDTIPVCEGRTDRQTTDRHGKSALCICVAR